MRRDQIIKIAMVVCAVVAACAVIISLTGMFGSGSLFSYANADKYTAGEAEVSGDIRNLEVNWTSGKVTITYHAEDTVTLKESANGTLSDDQKLRWWLDGDTLRVQYAKSNISIGWNKQKELTVTLPESMRLQRADIGTTSADLYAPTLKAEKVTLGSTSGDITAETDAKTVDAGATSGSIRLKLTADADSVKTGTTSGSVFLEAGKARKIDAGSTSGGIEIRAEEAGEVKIGCTSGTVRVNLRKPEKLHVSTTSGSITAGLSAEPGFTASVSTVSGSVNCGLAAAKNGDRYVCGDGSAAVELGSVSGSITIREAE